MQVRQCDRCKKILNKNNKLYSYAFDVRTDNYWTREILTGDFCSSCYEKFKVFINQEETYDN